MNGYGRMLLVGVLGVGVGCAGEPDDSEGAAPALEEPAAETATEPGTLETTPAAATALAVESLADGGAYLTDGSGRALYLLEGEPERESSCYDECAEEWPPFLASEGTATARGTALQNDLVGTIQRRDGSTQLTYNGHALYYYHDDRAPGQTTGHDVTDQWGEWYLVQPSGEPLEE